MKLCYSDIFTKEALYKISNYEIEAREKKFSFWYEPYLIKIIK